MMKPTATLLSLLMMVLSLLLMLDMTATALPQSPSPTVDAGTLTQSTPTAATCSPGCTLTALTATSYRCDCTARGPQACAGGYTRSAINALAYTCSV